MNSGWNFYTKYYELSGTTTISSMDQFIAYYREYLVNISSSSGQPNNVSSLTANISNNLTNSNINYSSNLLSIHVISYVTIFTLSIIVNILALITLIFNRRLQSFMSVFLINLTISDLLLTIFCIPFTLIGSVLKNFIFGSFMCKVIPYFQAVSVGVSVWTLVAISIERYYSICDSRKSEKLRKASYVSLIIWVSIVIVMSPIAFQSQLIATKIEDKYKCREVWSERSVEITFNIVLDMILLIIPLAIMAFNYTAIYLALNHQQCPQYNKDYTSNQMTETENADHISTIMNSGNASDAVNHDINCLNNCFVRNNAVKRHTTYTREGYLRRYQSRLNSRKNAIRMLCVLVAQFFICWTPLFIINTWGLFDTKQLYSVVGPNGISVAHLLAYCSSCTNPIIYCFMHTKFREALLRMLNRRIYRNNDSVFNPNIFNDDTDTHTSSSRNDISMSLVTPNINHHKHKY